MCLTCQGALRIIAAFSGLAPTEPPLANIKSAKKRARQAIKRRAHNVALRSRVRTAIRSVMKAVETGDKEAAKARFKAVVPEIDRMATKGILPKNRAAHYKSQLNARLRAMP